MRRAVVLSLVTAVLVVPAALAGTARERTTPGLLSAVSIAGTEVAYADEYRRGCHEIRLWDVALRGDRRISSHCFVSTSTGNGVQP
jgi:anti-sigma-K factor RskA